MVTTKTGIEPFEIQGSVEARKLLFDHMYAFFYLHTMN